MTFSELIEAALAEVGYGDRAEGLAAIAEHPALSKYRASDAEPVKGAFREKASSDIERRWLEAYRRVRSAALAAA